jgi:hypothetical protein
MRDRLAVHELDALDLASLWPLGGHANLAPLHAFADCRRVAGRGAELRQVTTANRGGRAAVVEQCGWFSERNKGGKPMGDDAIYFARRAAQELTAATEAEHPKAREAHLQMARHYRDLISTGAMR